MELLENLYYSFSERIYPIKASNEEEEAYKKFEKSLSKEQLQLYNEFYFQAGARLSKENKRWFRLGFTECLNMFLDATKREKLKY